MTQDQLPMVDTQSMNDTHFEAMLLINKLSTAIQDADVDAVNKNFIELIEHTEHHCKNEEEMMIEKKFPPYLAHKEEHDLALEDMRNVALEFTKTLDMESLKKYIELNLTPWFLQHTETMDAVTSMFLENSEAHLVHWDRLKKR
ncbi:MAG: hemerythrin family protein [Campylobacterota bacterium]|nr:hemerythrin family protein [Campylobacterota bacterium]